MQYKNVGLSGLRVTSVGLGCNNFGWKIDEEASRPVVHAALDEGITLFDTADYYGTPPGNAEIVLGRLLKGKRDQVLISSKFGVPQAGGAPNNSRSFVLRAVEASLKRLQTDWIDVYMIHWPDASTAMEETLRVLDDLVKSGKVRYIACSNLSDWRIVEAKWISRTASLHGFIASQSEYSLLNREAEKTLLPLLGAYGMGLMPYFPLASGLLTGKYLAEGARGRLNDNFLNLGNRFLTPENLEKARRLNDFARSRGHDLLTLAMSWLACQPLVSGIIAGATTAAQVRQNVAAASWKLDAADLAEVDEVLAGQGKRVAAT